jgi:hypothetical protein
MPVLFEPTSVQIQSTSTVRDATPHLGDRTPHLGDTTLHLRDPATTESQPFAVLDEATEHLRAPPDLQYA